MLLLSDYLASDEFLMNLVFSMMLRGYFIEKTNRIINNSIEYIYNPTFIIYKQDKSWIIYNPTHIINNLIGL